VQSLKAAGAVLLAWAVAGWWWNAPMALLAPWTALFLVQSTVYRSLLSALQQFVVVVAGTLLAAGAGVLTHSAMTAMALALLLTVLLGNYARFGDQGLYAPTAALFVLVYGYGSYTGYDILHRLLETLLGAAIGICVNALVLPPVHTRRVRHLRDRLPKDCAELLHTVADGIQEPYDEEQVRGWYGRAVRMTDQVMDLRVARRRSDESYRLNPGHRLRSSVPAPPTADWDVTWYQITEDIRATMRTLTETAALPDCVPVTLAALLRAAGDVAELPKGADDECPRALGVAAASHRQLTPSSRTAASRRCPRWAGWTADTQRLLDDLTSVVSVRSGKLRRTAGRAP
jgi:uncharacterized membrane protein YccC